MKALILAAGYGTRMQSVVGDIPKGLIQLGEQRIIDHIVARIQALSLDITLITNKKFHAQFESWKAQTETECLIVNNGTTQPEERLGAIGDLALAINEANLANDDLLIVGSDNFLGFSLTGLLDSYQSEPMTHVCIRENLNMEDQRRRGVVEIDKASRVKSFTEKPQSPASNYAAAPLYIIPSTALNQVEKYLQKGGNPDSPGYLFEYLVTQLPIKAWHIPGAILDVGNPESYREALAFVTSNQSLDN